MAKSRRNWSGVELNFTQGFAARNFPRDRAEIDHTYKRPAVGLACKRINGGSTTKNHSPTNPTSCACRLPHGKISLTPLDDSTLNLVLSFSNGVRLETAGSQFSGRPFEFVQESKVFNCIPLCEMKSPLGTQKFYFIQRRLDTKFENSKLGGVRCKISPKFV